MPPHLARVREASEDVAKVRAVAAAARRVAEAVHREAAPLAGERSNGVPLDPIELRAAVTAAELLEELAAVASLPGCASPTLADAAEAIESASVRSWLGSAEGRVRIVSPYRARAARCRHLFVCAMQEGVFPGARRARSAAGRGKPQAPGHRTPSPPRAGLRGALPLPRLRFAAYRDPHAELALV